MGNVMILTLESNTFSRIGFHLALAAVLRAGLLSPLFPGEEGDAGRPSDLLGPSVPHPGLCCV